MAFRGVRVTRKVGGDPTFLFSCSSAGHQVDRSEVGFEAVIRLQDHLQAERAHAGAHLPWHVPPLMEGPVIHRRETRKKTSRKCEGRALYARK